MVSDLNILWITSEMIMELGKYHKILAIGVHPDDIEYSIFGTLFKLKPGNKIYCYVASLGGFGDPTSGLVRKEESAKSLRVIDAAVFWRDEVGISNYHEIVSNLDLVLDQVNPDLVLAPSHNDSHQDHRMINECAVSSLRRRKISTLFYATLSSDSFTPHFYVDISQFFKYKKFALSFHQSQSDKLWMKENYLEVFNSDNQAKLMGIDYVEKFEVGKIFM